MPEAPERDYSHITQEELPASEFEDFIDDNKHVFIHFYTRWCKVCKPLHHVLPKVADKITDRGLEIKVRGFDVEADGAKQFTKKYKVQGHPTMLYFNHGHMEEEYRGDRNEHDIYHWLKDKVTPHYHEITVKEWKNLKDPHEFVVWGKINEEDEDKEEKFDDVADELGGKFTFYKTIVQSGDSKIVLRRTYFNDFDGPVKRVYKRKKWRKLNTWLEENTFHLFGEGMTFQQCRDVAHTGVLLIKIGEDNHMKMEELLFEWVSENTDVQACFARPSEMDQYGMKGLEEALVYVDAKHKKKDIKYVFDLHTVAWKDFKLKPDEEYLHHDEFPEKIASFLQQAEAGTYKRWRRTTETYVSKKKTVTLLSARDFDTFILKRENLVLVNYCNSYSPGCKKYKPIFIDLAEEIKHAFPERNLKFGIMSPTNNEHDLNIAKNPTLVFYPSHKQTKRVIFDGDAEDLDDLLDFIEDYLPRTSKDEL